MAIRAENIWATVVHSAPPANATLQNAWVTVVHSAPPANATLQNAWGTLIHTAADTSASISPASSSGATGVPVTLDGSASVADTFSWSFTSVPSGSAITVGGSYSTSSSLSFTPDVDGAYDIELSVSGVDYGESASDIALATFVAGTSSPSSLKRILTGSLLNRNNIISGSTTRRLVRRKLK